MAAYTRDGLHVHLPVRVLRSLGDVPFQRTRRLGDSSPLRAVRRRLCICAPTSLTLRFETRKEVALQTPFNLNVLSILYYGNTSDARK